jgi:hypothetical protein
MEGFTSTGATDGDRFSADSSHAWKGQSGKSSWWWQAHFPKGRHIGAILQINGDETTAFRNASSRYVWQWSNDGATWHNLTETATNAERRSFRVHRLNQSYDIKYIRILITKSAGDLPTLRELEFYDDPNSAISFPNWIIAVSTYDTPGVLTEADRFVTLARKCPGWENVLAQQVWLGDFDETFISAEPHPLCAFLSGNTKDWCERDREPWRGVQEILKGRNLPIWASCGGAQALAILEDVGVDKPWDCPRCRDPQKPKSPIYTHIGHTGNTPCGDYSKNIAERGKFTMKKESADPVLASLPEHFEVLESHIGQISYPPHGWVRIVTNGPGALTVNQCLRVRDRYIYAAQFHIEMPGAPQTAEAMMANFLRVAHEWGGYNPNGQPVPAPKPVDTNKRSS